MSYTVPSKTKGKLAALWATKGKLAAVGIERQVGSAVGPAALLSL